ncbi:MAG: hypothetical protein AAB388_05175 [Patescibacteria group bacterium]
MSQQTCFIPALLYRCLKKETITTDVTLKRTVVASNDLCGFKLRGYTVTGSGKSIAIFKKKNRLISLKSYSVLNKGGVYPVLGVAENAPSVIIDTEGAPFVKSWPLQRHSMKFVLKMLASFSGYNFKLHLVSGPAFTPRKKEIGVIHVVLGAAPDGPLQDEYVNKLCGIWLDPDGDRSFPRSFTPGRGTYVKDSEGAIIAQYVDSTIYLLLPFRDSDQYALMYKPTARPDLFRAAMKIAWNGYVPKNLKRAVLPPMTKDSFASFAKERKKRLFEHFASEIKETNESIERLTAELQSKLNLKRQLLRMKAGLESAVAVDEKELITSWPQIMRNPLLHKLHEHEEAIFLETKPIIIDYKGTRRKIGRFVIRYKFGGQPGIWAIEAAHPRLIAHPHISPNGAVCFGNATFAIEQAAAEARIEDLFSLICRWLRDGYEPTLADTKVEEWPEVTNE